MANGTTKTARRKARAKTGERSSANERVATEAIQRTYAVADLELEGTIVSANENLLSLVGYTAEEIVGRHHSFLLDADRKNRQAYQELWPRLQRGESVSAEYPHRHKDGTTVWARVCFMPILNAAGKPTKIATLATDITAEQQAEVERTGRLTAIDEAQAVIEFQLDGTILDANQNFLSSMGYTLEEIQGRHHSIFVAPETRNSVEYRELWSQLNQGQHQSGVFRRFGKAGNEVWIQGTYHPINDLQGRPCKVIKFATDVTEQKQIAAENAGQMAAVNRSQAVIEFQMDGTIITANQNFLDAMGYTLEEIQGRHHRMFVDDDLRSSDEYREFWEQLNRGKYLHGEYRRTGKNGREVWIQGSYNPILDAKGEPFKVVKFATDVTDRVKLQIATAEHQEKTQNLIQQVIEAAQQQNQGAPNHRRE